MTVFVKETTTTFKMLYQRMRAKLQMEGKIREAHEDEMAALARMNQAHAAMYFTMRNLDSTLTECERAHDVMVQRVKEVGTAALRVRLARAAARDEEMERKGTHAGSWR